MHARTHACICGRRKLSSGRWRGKRSRSVIIRLLVCWVRRCGRWMLEDLSVSQVQAGAARRGPDIRMLFLLLKQIDKKVNWKKVKCCKPPPNSNQLDRSILFPHTNRSVASEWERMGDKTKICVGKTASSFVSRSVSFHPNPRHSVLVTTHTYIQRGRATQRGIERREREMMMHRVSKMQTFSDWAQPASHRHLPYFNLRSSMVMHALVCLGNAFLWNGRFRDAISATNLTRVAAAVFPHKQRIKNDATALVRFSLKRSLRALPRTCCSNLSSPSSRPTVLQNRSCPGHSVALWR